MGLDDIVLERLKVASERGIAEVAALRWAAWHGDLESFGKGRYERAKQQLAKLEAEIDGNGNSDDA